VNEWLKGESGQEMNFWETKNDKNDENEIDYFYHKSFDRVLTDWVMGSIYHTQSNDCPH
jgi:hypothetical protein